MKTRQKQLEKNICSTMRSVEATNRSLMTQADKKAQILIQVNGLMTSVLLALALYIDPAHRWFLLPVAIQLLSSLIVITTGLLVTKPRFFDSNVSTYLINNQGTGNSPSFADPYLYWSLLRDSHRQATILAVKYKRLRLSYHVFMAGLFLSMLATLAVFIVAR